MIGAVEAFFVWGPIRIPPCPSYDGWTEKGQYCEFDWSGRSNQFNSISKIYISQTQGSYQGGWKGSYAEAKKKCEDDLGATLVREPDMLEAVRLCCHSLHYTMIICQIEISDNFLEQGLAIHIVPRFFLQGRFLERLLDWTEN